MTTQPSDRIRLASWPTPLEPAPRLAGALGLGPDDLWIKRDDLTGLAGGGNKIRKLEWTVAAAIAAGADALVTTGAPQSNHARLTAAAGARLGLRVVLVFPGDPGGAQSGNLALDGLLGARIAWAADVGLAEAEAFATGRKIRVTKVPYLATAKALINDDPGGFVKIVSDPATGVVLGGSIVGRHAAELISVLALAVTAHLKVSDIVESCLAHPTLSEALAEAAE